MKNFSSGMDQWENTLLKVDFKNQSNCLAFIEVYVVLNIWFHTKGKKQTYFV